MKMKRWAWWKKLLNLLIKAGIWSMLLTPFHEAWHAQAARWLGSEAKVVYSSFWHGGTTAYDPSVANSNLYLMAGGVGVALMCLVLWLMARWTPTYFDLADEWVLAAFGAFEFGYGITEPTVKHNQNPEIAIPLVIGVLLIPVMVYYAYRWGRWVSGELKEE